MPSFTIQQCAIPAVTFLICLIAYPSLWLLRRLGPLPLTEQQSIILHVYAVVIIYCYYKACFTDPGRIPKNWVPKQSDTVRDRNSEDERQRQRWCRKCQAFKPPRAHHCKTCERFVASSNIADLVPHLTEQGVFPRWITTGRSYPHLPINIVLTPVAPGQPIAFPTQLFRILFASCFMPLLACHISNVFLGRGCIIYGRRAIYQVYVFMCYNVCHHLIVLLVSWSKSRVDVWPFLHDRIEFCSRLCVVHSACSYSVVFGSEHNHH